MNEGGKERKNRRMRSTKIRGGIKHYWERNCSVQFNVDVVHVDVARLSPNCGPPTSLSFIPQIII
jgi:hypothetical protein